MLPDLYSLPFQHVVLQVTFIFPVTSKQSRVSRSSPAMWLKRPSRQERIWKGRGWESLLHESWYNFPMRSFGIFHLPLGTGEQRPHRAEQRGMFNPFVGPNPPERRLVLKFGLGSDWGELDGPHLTFACFCSPLFFFFSRVIVWEWF